MYDTGYLPLLAQNIAENINGVKVLLCDCIRLNWEMVICNPYVQEEKVNSKEIQLALDCSPDSPVREEVKLPNDRHSKEREGELSTLLT